MRLCLALLLATGASACSDDIVLPPPTEAAFTVWGTLNPDTSAQAIRVVPVLPIIDGERPEPLDASVTTTDLATGVTTAWADSVVTFPGGRIGHVFHTTAEVAYGSRQFVRVARSDGAETTAYVRVPPAVVPVAEAPVLTNGFNPNVTYPTLWPQAPQLDILRVRYDLQAGDCSLFSLTAPGDNGAVVAVPTDAGWRASLSLDKAVAQGTFGSGAPGGTLLGITLETLVSGVDARPPGGTFDPALFFDPGQFSNVDNGFGLVVGAYRRMVSWVPDIALTMRSGFGPKSRNC